MFVSSMQRGPFAGSAVARNPADGRQPGLLQYDTYPAVRQPGSIAMSPASSGIGTYICIIVCLQQRSVARRTMCIQHVPDVATWHALSGQGVSCVHLVMAEVCCLKAVPCVLHVWPAMVWSMISCALPVTVQHAICKLEARHVFQVAQG